MAPPPPRFSLHGFANVNALGQRVSGDGESASESAFEIGELDLLLAAEFGPRARFFSEVVFEPEDLDKAQVIDVERLWMRYEFSDAGWVAVGRDHTSLGWWHTTFHHGLLLMPTIRRPRIIEYEDHGGILPLHITGLEGGGSVRGRQWSLQGVGALANGRAAVPTEVSAFGDANKRKGLNARVEVIRISGLREMRMGASGYWDTIPPDPDDPLRPVPIKERIGGVHFVFDDPRMQFVTEYYKLRNQAQDAADWSVSSGWFALFLYKPWAWKPYAGYDQMVVPDDDPYFIGYGTDYSRWLLGARRDLHPFVALKFEAWRERTEDTTVKSLAAQIAIGF